MVEIVFVDTSALLAGLDVEDGGHPVAASHWHRLLDGIAAGQIAGITHSYVVSEAMSLAQRRMGMAAVWRLNDALLKPLMVIWVDQELHHRALAAMLAANRRSVSLVDWTSFELMRSRGITHALAFDTYFTEQGFTLPWD